MERGKRVDLNNGEIPLPAPIIQDIQYRLSKKEAARTTVLSKSWYRAWSTRPDIDLDLNHIYRRVKYQRAPIPNPFPEYARRTMRRYDELNLKIKTFRLYMKWFRRGDKLLAGELIVKAMQLGVEDMDVGYIPLDRCEFIFPPELVPEDMDAVIPLGRSKFIFPPEVLGYENLVRLSLSGCRFEKGADEGISWLNLKFFSLCRVYFTADELWDIMMRCPLVEKLELSHCIFLFEYCPLRNKNICLCLGPYGFGAQKIINNSVILYAFNRLTYLVLSYVKISPRFLHDFSSKFPCLKDLTLCCCLGPKKIYIISHSLESIKIDQIIMLRAYIDVSSLRKFSLSSNHIPSLTFGIVSGEWESHVSARCSKFLSNSSFHHFKKFLTVMSSSKLYLSLNLTQCSQYNLNLAIGIECGPVLENLMINASALETHSFWDGLFWSCRPMLITTYFSSMPDIEALDAAYKRLIIVGDNSYSANKRMPGQSDLEEVNVEFFYENSAEWKLVSWKTLLDYWKTLLYNSTIIGKKQKMRIHFKWDK